MLRTEQSDVAFLNVEGFWNDELVDGAVIVLPFPDEGVILVDNFLMCIHDELEEIVNILALRVWLQAVPIVLSYGVLVWQ
jgi:hypothetical protein